MRNTRGDNNLKGPRIGRECKVRATESGLEILRPERWEPSEFWKKVDDELIQRVTSLQNDLKPKNIEVIGLGKTQRELDKVVIEKQTLPSNNQEIDFSAVRTDIFATFQELKTHSGRLAELFGAETLKNDELKEIFTYAPENKKVYVQMRNSRLIQNLPQVLKGVSSIDSSTKCEDLLKNIKKAKIKVKILEDLEERREVSNNGLNNEESSSNYPEVTYSLEESRTINANPRNSQKRRVIIHEEGSSDEETDSSLLRKYGRYDFMNKRISNENTTRALEKKSSDEETDSSLLRKYGRYDFTNKRSSNENTTRALKKKNGKHALKSKHGIFYYEGGLNDKQQKEGKGRLYYPNGDIYDGYFKNDKREGEGKLYFKLGGLHEYAGGWYDGNFKDDLMDGPGELFDKNGVMIFKGEFEKGFQKYGRLLLSGSDWYVGEFSNNHRHGHGILYVKNDIALEGPWEYGRKHGEFKRYKTWKFDNDVVPQLIEGSTFDTVYYKHDILSDAPPRKNKIQIILSNGKTEDAKVSTYTSKPTKEIIYRYGIRITTEDLKTLEGANPLGANIVNFYMRAIEAEYLKLRYESDRGNPQSILFLDSDFFSELTADQLDSETTHYKEVSPRFAAYSTPQYLIFDEFERILLIVKKKSQHWILAEISCPKKPGAGTLEKIVFRIYDSMINKPDGTPTPEKYPVTRHLFEFVRNEMKKVKQTDETKKIIKDLQDSPIIFEEVPQQRDFHNCGVFVSRFVQYIAAGRTKFDFDSQVRSMNDFRNEIRNVILGIYANPLELERS